MSTIEQVVEQLEADAGLADALKGTVDENMAALKALYTAHHGAVGLDAYDWHWIATHLKYQETDHAADSHDAAGVSTQAHDTASGEAGHADQASGGATAHASFGPLT